MHLPEFILQTQKLERAPPTLCSSPACKYDPLTAIQPLHVWHEPTAPRALAPKPIKTSILAYEPPPPSLPDTHSASYYHHAELRATSVAHQHLIIGPILIRKKTMDTSGAISYCVEFQCVHQGLGMAATLATVLHKCIIFPVLH